MQLSLNNLPALPAGVGKPAYGRADMSAGIVHIGLGNFHRAHQAWYLHRLMQQGLALDWAILGAGVRPADAAQRVKMLAQDCLTTLIELAPTGTSAEVIGSMIGYIPLDEGNAALIAQMADPSIRIVSLTVTEGGYFQASDGRLDVTNLDILHDGAHPTHPKTAFGAIIAALKLRRAAQAGPFTCLSCDNLQGNGDVLRQTVVGLAALSDQTLAAWIDQHVTFPNSMVDCIVPATGPAELAVVREFGIEDTVPVTHENFRQWVIEDRFCASRPDWDKVGATFTDDVHSYEKMKLRLLNGSHQVISTAGELLSVQTIAGTMQDADIHRLFRKIAEQEILPHVAPVKDMTPRAYIDLIEHRFANAAVRDTTRRVAFDGSSRHPAFVHPILRDAIRANAPIEGLALTEALWARMCAGIRDDGSVISPNDPVWDQLEVVARLARDDPQRWLSQTQYYGDLAQDPRFAQSFAHWLRVVWQDGTRAALQTFAAR